MRWIGEHICDWRAAAMPLLLLAFVGPWAMDEVNVPGEFPCLAPFIRLRGDFCGLPLTGLWVLSTLVREFAARAGALASGDVTVVVLRDAFLIVVFAILVLLPFITAVLSVLRGDRRIERPLRVVLWGLTVAWSLSYALLARVSPPLRVWGIWLYVGVACVALAWEGLSPALGRSSGEAR